MVTISDRVWQHWDRIAAMSAEPALVLLVRSGLAQREALEALTEAATAAVHALDAQADDPEFRAGAWSLAPVPGGIVVRIDEEPDDFEALVRGIAAELEARGVAATLDVYEPEDIVALPDVVPLLECRLRIRGTRRPHRGKKWRWEADRGSRAVAVDQALAWCASDDADRRLGLVVGLVTSGVLAADETLRATVRDALDTTEEVGTVVLTSAGRDDFRSVAIEPSNGRVAFIVGGSSLGRGWVGELAGLRDLLRAAGSWSAYGFVKRGSYRVAAELGTSLAQDWVHISRFDPGTSAAVAFEAELAPDAFGLQLLGPEYGGRIPRGDDWSALEVAGGATVVAHGDPAAWFDGRLAPFRGFPLSTPPRDQVPDVVARARADFDPILFDARVARGA